MMGVHQHVQRYLLTQFGQGTADIQIAQVSADQNLSTATVLAEQQPFAQASGIVQLHLLQSQLAAPHVESVQQTVGESHELAKHVAQSRLQFGAVAPARQIVLILPNVAPRLSAEHEEIQHDQIQHGRHRAASEMTHGERSELHQHEAAALLLCRPVRAAGAAISHVPAPHIDVRTTRALRPGGRRNAACRVPRPGAG